MKKISRGGFRGVWPVLQRELREGARRPFNHWLRVGSAAGGMVLFYFAGQNSNVPVAYIGAQLFACIHTLLLLLICCFVPAMTADCISREKRDGTLGLLFLTPLTAGGIVVGKGATQSLRTFTLWLAVLPILMVPVLIGGVNWIDGATAVSIEFCATVLCLATGLVASTLTKSAAATFVLAPLLGGFLLINFWHFLVDNFLPVGVGGFQALTGLFIEDSEEFFSDFQPGVWNAIPQAKWISVLIATAAGALFIYFFAVIYAAHRIKASWQDHPPSLREEKLLQQYCSPIFQRWFSRRTQRAMDWNPLAWLQQYSWKARLFKWGLCLACVVAECIITESCASHGYHGEWTAWQEMLLRGLGVAFTFVGVNGFLREKETGVLELILVTPLSANQIIFGRAWGLWEQFLPAALASGGSYFALIVLTGFDLGNWFDFCLAVCGFLSMPVFTTYFALCVKNVIGAAVLTWGALFCVYVIAEVLHYFLDRYFQGYMPGSDTLDLDLIWFPISIVAATFALTLPIYFRLRRNLSRRIYSF